ncbi:hypothetical protein PMZ80_006853, partial [Knufia obscura]
KQEGIGRTSDETKAPGSTGIIGKIKNPKLTMTTHEAHTNYLQQFAKRNDPDKDKSR